MQTANSNFFRLSHFTFGLPYVLFCGVVIHTFFGCAILLLGFHTFFFAVSLCILFSVVPFYFWASIRSFFAVSLCILFSVVPFYFWASIRSFLRCRYISDHPKNAISSTFCSCKTTIWYQLWSPPPLGTSHLIIFTSSETSLIRLIWNLNQIRDTARRAQVYICQINICQSDFRSCKQQTATFFGCPILLLGFHTFFFAVSLYILFSVVPFYFWASIRSFLRCRYISDHPKNAISSIFCSCKITIWYQLW